MTASIAQSVLIIEDDDDTSQNLVDILELDGYTARTASSFAAAVEHADWHDLLAIVLDRRLPDGSADAFLPQLQSLAPSVPIIIITGSADVEGTIAALRAGAQDYLIKPIDPDLLRARLARIAESRRDKEELKLAQERLLQSERLAAIGQMMTGLAHESRNALQRSQACLEMLKLEVEAQPVVLDLIARIQKAQDHLHQLYEEVRDYAAPIRLKRELHDLQAILHDTWDHISALRKSRDVHLEFHASEAHSYCSVDRFAIEQVFRNILENSLSACTDPVRIRATFQTTSLDGEPACKISLADNGPGLSPTARDKIFEPFFTTKTKGTGLGMAIVRRIVETHLGRITVGSAGPGAEILIILPARELPGQRS
ncbi:MAG: response regulator [Planctomycetes bacterium]|nr:response regulator [Planctomycetota bacterium]